MNDSPNDEILKAVNKILEFANIPINQQLVKKYSKQDMVNFACEVYNKHYNSDKSFKEIANDLINEKPYGEFI